MDLAVIPAIIFGLFEPGQLDEVTLQIATDRGVLHYTSEIADDPLEQMRGLMHRSAIGDREGMLFVYPEDRHAKFWMKNVAFPVDIIFLDRCGVIVGVHENAQPDDASVITSRNAVAAVLEVPAGASKRDQMRIGTKFVSIGVDVFEGCDAGR